MDKGINQWTGNSFFRVLSFKQGYLFSFLASEGLGGTLLPKLPLNALPGIFSGGSGGGARPPLFLDQNEARRAKKNLFEAAPSPYLRKV